MTAYTVERPKNAVEGKHVIDLFIGNDVVTDGAFGQQAWEFTAIGNGAAPTYLAPGAGDPPGGFRHTTAGTANGDGDTFQSNDDGIVFPASGKGGGFAFMARYPNVAGNALAGNNFRIGVETSLTAADPTDGICVHSDAGVITLRSDSADHGDTSQAAAGVTTLTSGTTMVLGTWHLFEVYWSGENGQGGPRFVELFVDGEPAASVLCNIDDDETAELKMTHWQDSGGADTLELDVAFYEYFQFHDLPLAAAL